MIGHPHQAGVSYYPDGSIVLHKAWTKRGAKGQQLIYQAPEAMKLHGSTIDHISKSIGEARITLSFPHDTRHQRPVPGLQPVQEKHKVLSYDEHGNGFTTTAHTYRAADVLQDHATAQKVFQHYDVHELVEKLANQAKAPKQPKHIFIERTANGKKYTFIAHSYGVEHELRVGTPGADSTSAAKRGMGQMRQRLNELCQGIMQSMRDPLDTGRTGGRVIFTSALLNVFVLALVASLGLYELHKNDEQAKKLLQEG